MEKYNLLEEPWIVVMTDDKGSTKKVSLIELFNNAENYKKLAGDLPVQDFAILRFLLSIIHTVFSRFDINGDILEYVELNDNYIPKSEIDEYEEEDYNFGMKKTWKELWESEKFPEIISKYLEKWEDKFNLLDSEYPFYQITEKDLKSKNIEKTGKINFKLMNRLLSESNNKIELFSSFGEKQKNSLSLDEIARWLITFQGYTGTGDKAKYPEMTESASKGWLLGLGGVYISGKNLKETLLLNMCLKDEKNIQKPIWEKELDEKIEDILYEKPNNLAELYTNWSRLLIMDKDEKTKKFSFKAVQLPGIDPKEMFLEPMTLWMFPKTGNNKDTFVPKTHNPNQAFWRSFGLISKEDDITENHRKPKIMEWFNEISEDIKFESENIMINSIGLSYNRDASTMPNDDIYDYINISYNVLSDVEKKGWVYRIDDEITIIKDIIEKILRGFAMDIKNIRNIENTGMIDTIVQNAYYEIDIPFRNWLSEIKSEDEKELKIAEWRDKLRNIMLSQGKLLVKNSSKRDFLGITKDDKYMNIEIAYNKFLSRLYNKLPIEKGEDNGEKN